VKLQNFVSLLPMGKFSPGEIQTTRELPTPATLLYLGAGLLLAAEAHSMPCIPFSETPFLPQLSDMEHSFLCSGSKHSAEGRPSKECFTHVPIHSSGAIKPTEASLASLFARRQGSVHAGIP